MPRIVHSGSADPDPYALLGRWRLDRRVTDRLAGLTGRMWGTLTVSGHSAGPGRARTPGPSIGLRWEEEGTLDWGGRRLGAQRTLTLRLIGGEWWMTFEDGGLFHPWQPGQRLEHPCGADRYLGRLDVDREARRMRILWEVTGPSKSQRIFTRYRRGAGSSLGIPGIDARDAL